jgi:cbb3-type cytochrome oxidase maturation protein
MDILYLLIPLSVALVFCILAGLWWAIYRGQFEDIEAEDALFKDGKLVHFLERHHIEGGTAQMIAENLMEAYNEFC